MEIFQIHSKDALAAINHYAALNAIQSVDWSPNFNEETYREIGNPDDVARSIAPDLSGSFQSTATGSTVALLKRMIVAHDPVTGAFTGYMAGDPATADNAGTVRHTDLEHACFDFAMVKTPNQIFDRTELLTRLFLTSVAFSANVDGSATETYSFDGDPVEVYRDPYHDVKSVPVTRVNATTVRVPEQYLVDVPAGVLDGTEFMLTGLYVDNDRIGTSALSVSDPGDGTGRTVQITNGRTIKSGARVQVIMYRIVPGAAPVIEYPTSSRFTKADQIDIWLVPVSRLNIETALDGGASLNDLAFNEDEFILRVQSAEVRLEIAREVLRQIKRNSRKSAVYHRAINEIQVNSSLNVLETTYDDWATMQDRAAAQASGEDFLDLASFEGKAWQIVMRYYHLDTTVQTMAVLDARVSGRGVQLSVGGRSEISWNFSGSKWAISGSNV